MALLVSPNSFPFGASTVVRKVAAAVLERVPDAERILRGLGLGTVFVVVSLAAGVGAAATLNWGLLTRTETAAHFNPASAPDTPRPSPTPNVALLPPSAAELSLLVATATPGPTIAPTATPLPIASVTAESATTAPTPTVDQAWQSLQNSLDSAWGSDTPRTVVLLDDFLARFPDVQLAREKLYAALIARASDLVTAGMKDQAVDDLKQATILVPDRPEANDALRALTPAPATNAAD